jgi:hypothetical protein
MYQALLRCPFVNDVHIMHSHIHKVQCMLCIQLIEGTICTRVCIILVRPIVDCMYAHRNCAYKKGSAAYSMSVMLC